jgi:hypothetical protein
MGFAGREGGAGRVAKRTEKGAKKGTKIKLGKYSAENQMFFCIFARFKKLKQKI